VTTATPRADSRFTPVSTRAAWFGLVVLTLINLLGYIDRNVVPPLGVSLKASPLHVTDVQFGALGSAFLFVYLVTAPVFGVLGDSRSRPRLIAFGVGMWSIASLVGGLAPHYAALFGSRAAVGIGEAAYGSIAPALLADYFPERMRARAFAVLFMALPVGTALGLITGGVMNAHYGWRSALFVAGAPGLVLAVIALRLLDPPRGSLDAPTAPVAARTAVPSLGVYLALARLRTYRHIVLGYAAYSFGLGGINFWMPGFLERVRGLSSQTASVGLGGVLVLTGLTGTFAGGWIADRLEPRVPNARLLVSGVATLAAAPVAFLALTSPVPAVYWSAIAVAEVLVFMSTAPINAAIIEAVPTNMRASAMAACIFAIHIIGDVPSTTIIGAVSEHVGLARAVLLVPVAILVAGGWWLVVGHQRRP
jgi:predicted MFS family arabinose efflux permease